MNPWRIIDLSVLCEKGQQVYSTSAYREFFEKYFQSRLVSRSTPASSQLSVWTRNRQYCIVFSAPMKHGSPFTAHLNLSRRSLHRGTPGEKISLALPFLQDEEVMEMECMCLFIEKVLETRYSSSESQPV